MQKKIRMHMCRAYHTEGSLSRDGRAMNGMWYVCVEARGRRIISPDRHGNRRMSRARSRLAPSSSSPIVRLRADSSALGRARAASRTSEANRSLGAGSLRATSFGVRRISRRSAASTFTTVALAFGARPISRYRTSAGRHAFAWLPRVHNGTRKEKRVGKLVVFSP